MLAYLFWHTPKPTTGGVEYERDLLAFSHALSGLNCFGVRRIANFRISAVPWLDDPSGYEDWVTIDGSHVLENLNDQAVSARMAPLHGRIAQQMGVGYGGLYYHLWGNMDPHVAESAHWLSRSRGVEFRPVLEHMLQGGGEPVSVWRRFMVLGSGFEFVILGNASLALRIPDGWIAHRVARTILN